MFESHKTQFFTHIVTVPRLSSSSSLCSRCSSMASDSPFWLCSAISWLKESWTTSSSRGLLTEGHADMRTRREKSETEGRRARFKDTLEHRALWGLVQTQVTAAPRGGDDKQTTQQERMKWSSFICDQHSLDFCVILFLCYLDGLESKPTGLSVCCHSKKTLTNRQQVQFPLNKHLQMECKHTHRHTFKHWLYDPSSC